MPLNIYFWKICALFPAYFGKMSACFLRIFGKMCALFPACFVRRVLWTAGAVPGSAPLLPLAVIKPRTDFIRILPVFTRIPAVFKPVPMPVQFVRIPTAEYASPKNAKKLDLFWKISFELNFIRHNRLLLRILLGCKLFFGCFLFDRLIKLTKNSWQPYNLAV